MVTFGVDDVLPAAEALPTEALGDVFAGDVREPLLGAIAKRIRTRMGDRVARRYLSVLRIGQRAD